MSTPLTAAQFEALARAAHIPLVLHSGWATRNRGNRLTGWGPVNGVLIHHTVTHDLDSTISLVINGRSDLPGPLYAGVVDRSGVLHMVGWGRCNHAGAGDGDVLQAVIREDATLPPANQANTDGNSRFYGFAGINWGDMKDPWPQVQLDTLARVSTVICRHHGWTERSVIGHQDWEPGKVDPRGPQGYLMPAIRYSVKTWLGQ